MNTANYHERESANYVGIAFCRDENTMITVTSDSLSFMR